MVSVTGAIIGIVILVVVAGVFAQQLQEIISAGQSYLQANGVQSGLGINPKAGQQVCDLKLVFKPNLVSLPAFFQDQGGSFLSPIAGWDLQGGASVVSWQNCHSYGLPLSWVPWPNGITTSNALVPADILLSTGYTEHIWLTVLGPNGSVKSYLTDPLCTSLCTTAQIPSGAVFVPKQYTFTFLITNLPKQNYQVSVTSELPFNGQGAGVAYVQNVSG